MFSELFNTGTLLPIINRNIFRINNIGADLRLYFVMYNQAEEIICEGIDQVAIYLIIGWKLYGYSDSKKLAISLLHECKHY